MNAIEKLAKLAEEVSGSGGCMDENRHLDPSALPRIVTQVDKPAPKSLRDLEDEIARLQAEVKRFSETETQSSRPRSSRDRRSVDLDRVDDYPGSDSSRRPRASCCLKGINFLVVQKFAGVE